MQVVHRRTGCTIDRTCTIVHSTWTSGKLIIYQHLITWWLKWVTTSGRLISSAQSGEPDNARLKIAAAHAGRVIVDYKSRRAFQSASQLRIRIIRININLYIKYITNTLPLSLSIYNYQPCGRVNLNMVAEGSSLDWELYWAKFLKQQVNYDSVDNEQAYM